MKKVCAVLSLVLAIGWGEALAQNAGHRISSNQVVIDSHSHWENWDFPQGTLVISPAGEVTPNRLRRDTNAAEDIVDYLRLNPPEGLDKEGEEITIFDAIQAGSNVEGVANLLDGDMSTYWEPDPLVPDKPVNDQWWFTIDLGRYVLANRIVLKFVEEGMGDPFLLFNLLVSDGRRPPSLPLAPTPEFRPMARMFTPNKTQRLFDIELPSAEELKGQGIRFLQVVVTGTDSTRGAEIGQEEYERLLAESPRDAGAVEYYKRQPDGREIRVDAGVYEALTADRQGSIHYYRRERPRLAEVEVWHEGDEILMGNKARGGEVTESDGNIITSVLADGDVVALASMTEYAPVPPYSAEGYVQYDLKSFFWIDRFMILYLSAGSRNKFDDYRLDFSDGTLAADGSLKWEAAVDRHMNTAYTIGHEFNEFEPVKARYFRFVFKRIGGPGSGSGAPVNVPEMHLYGEGYQPQVSLESDLIRLGGSRNLLSIEWEADTPPGTEVVLQSRTGNELEVVRTYYKQLNPLLPKKEVTEEQYNALPEKQKAGFDEVTNLGSDWSDWSEPYKEAAGSPIASPSPREFVILRATLISDDQDVAATLKSVHLNFASPVATRLLGEVEPFVVDSLGVLRTFSLYVRPEFDAGNPGFDELLLNGPPDMDFEFVRLYGGRQSDFAAEDADLAGLALEDVEIIPSRGDSLRISFPAVTRDSGMELLRMDFSTALYSTGALLHVALQNAAAGSGWQRVDVGDAAEHVASNTTTLVGARTSKDLLKNVAVEPPTFTPNGDGINDEAVFAFEVLRLGDDSPVEVAIYDLSGRLVRRLVEQRAIGSGRYDIAWDGNDESGERVPPGTYFARLGVDSDTDGASVENESVLRMVAVVY